MRPILRYILTLLLLCGSVKAQFDTDSLRRSIASTNSDSVKLRAYAYLAYSYTSINDDLSGKYSDTILMITSKPEYSKARFYQLQRSFALDKKGAILYQKGKYDEALVFSKQALKINEKLNFKSRIATSLGVIGGLLKAIGNKEALSYYGQSVRMLEEVHALENDVRSKQALATGYHNLGATYAYFFYSDSAMFCFKKGLSLLDTTRPQLDVALVYSGIAQAYKMKENYRSAVLSETKALNIYTKLGSLDGVTTTYNGFSDIYLEAKDYRKAIEYSELAEKIARENELSEDLLYSYETRFLAYEKLGDVKNENIFLKKHAALKDSIARQNHEFQIQELKTQYETEKKEQAIEKLSKENEIKKLQNNRLIIIIVTVAVLAVLLIWLAVFLQRIIRERKQAYIKLQEKNVYIQKQGELLSEQTKLISKYQSQMNPHFIFNALNSIQGFVVNDEKQRTIDQLQLFSALMRQTLNNSNDEQISLDAEIKYLTTYVQFEQSRFKEPLKFEFELPKDSEDILVPPMMIQPFIENCIKHAGLHKIENATINLVITTEDKLLKVLVKDNGLGFDTSNEDVFKRSHAVSMIRSRLTILFKAAGMEFKSSYFDMRSKPQLEKGTEVIFYLPLNYKY